MTGPDDWVILVCPPGAETASISHGTPKGREWPDQPDQHRSEVTQPVVRHAEIQQHETPACHFVEQHKPLPIPGKGAEHGGGTRSGVRRQMIAFLAVSQRRR